MSLQKINNEEMSFNLLPLAIQHNFLLSYTKKISEKLIEEEEKNKALMAEIRELNDTNRLLQIKKEHIIIKIIGTIIKEFPNKTHRPHMVKIMSIIKSV